MKIALIVIVALIILFYTYRLLHDVLKRLSLVRKLKRLEGKIGAKVKILKNPLASLFRISKTPEIAVETEDKVFLMRLISAGGFFKFMHFVNEKYTVSFCRSRVFTGGDSVLGELTTYARKVRIFPDYDASYDSGDKTVVNVYMFNPTPMAVTYVSEEKTSMGVAMIGAELYGYKVFTGTSFVEHLTENKWQALPEVEENKNENLAPKLDRGTHVLVNIPPKEYSGAAVDPKAKNREVRRTARALILLFAVLELFAASFLIYWFRTGLEGTLGFYAVIVQVAVAGAYISINRKLHMFSRLGKACEGEIIKISMFAVAKFRIYPIIPLWRQYYDNMNVVDTKCVVYIREKDGNVVTVPVLPAHTQVYKQGDRVYKHSSLPFPVISPDEPRELICPACGSVERKGFIQCHDCNCALTDEALAEKETVSK